MLPSLIGTIGWSKRRIATMGTPHCLGSLLSGDALPCRGRMSLGTYEAPGSSEPVDGRVTSMIPTSPASSNTDIHSLDADAVYPSACDKSQFTAAAAESTSRMGRRHTPCRDSST
jgi:hypothetical protein